MGKVDGVECEHRLGTLWSHRLGALISTRRRSKALAQKRSRLPAEVKGALLEHVFIRFGIRGRYGARGVMGNCTTTGEHLEKGFGQDDVMSRRHDTSKLSRYYYQCKRGLYPSFQG